MTGAPVIASGHFVLLVPGADFSLAGFGHGARLDSVRLATPTSGLSRRSGAEARRRDQASAGPVMGSHLKKPICRAFSSCSSSGPSISCCPRRPARPSTSSLSNGLGERSGLSRCGRWRRRRSGCASQGTPRYGLVFPSLRPRRRAHRASVRPPPAPTPPTLRQQRACIGLPADANELPVEELLDTKGAELAAKAGPLRPAERQFWRIEAHPVDEDHARVKGIRNP